MSYDVNIYIFCFCGFFFGEVVLFVFVVVMLVSKGVVGVDEVFLFIIVLVVMFDVGVVLLEGFFLILFGDIGVDWVIVGVGFVVVMLVVVIVGGLFDWFLELLKRKF